MRRWALAAALLPLAGCGGGAALLHGAHVLGEGKTTVGAGVSGTFLTGQAATELRAARNVPDTSATGASATEASREAYGKGAAAVAAFGPGTAPWVSARVGLPYDFEGGVTYTGRAIRIDARHAWQNERFALSVGAGASALSPSHAASGSQLAGLDLRAKGGLGSFGVDAPVLVGFKSPSDLLSVWLGPRFGYERMRAEATFGIEPSATPGNLSLERVYYGGVVGFSLGFRRLYGAIELDISQQSYSGDVLGQKLEGSAFTLTPAAALVAKF